MLALIVANVSISSTLSTSGEELRKMEIERQQLEESNIRLKEHILEAHSLNKLQTLANELGFVKPSQIVAYSSDSKDVALKP